MLFRSFNAFGFWLRVPQLPIADLFGDGEELLKQLPEAVVFLQLLTRLLHGGSGRDDPGHRLAGHRTCEGKGRAMALRTLVGAMARRLATLAEAGYQGTRASHRFARVEISTGRVVVAGPRGRLKEA